jgi:hypothetical protein
VKGNSLQCGDHACYIMKSDVSKIRVLCVSSVKHMRASRPVLEFCLVAPA